VQQARQRLSLARRGDRPAPLARRGDRPAPAHKSFSDRTSLYPEITDKIIAELAQGRVPWVQPWGGVNAPLGVPHNAATDRHYSGINILILRPRDRTRSKKRFFY
jgi:N-terminal domain of anti-restriction factor ArdC